LPGRSWFKHQIYAPDAYTGHGVKTLPAVREPIEQHKRAIADASTVTVGQVLLDESAVIKAATEKLRALVPAAVSWETAGAK
jgi:N-acetylated-alpha-linked acidic dipeptidase